MKSLLPIAIAALFFTEKLAAQTTLYILANQRCANRLEYFSRDQAANSAPVVTYSFAPGNDQLILLDLGTEGDKVMPYLPKGVQTCQNLYLTDATVQGINNGSVRAFLLQAASGGYLVSAVASATKVNRAGSFYVFQGKNYGFALDTTALNYDQNLAASGSGAFVFYNGLNYDGCHPVYTFHREPDRVCTTKTDFDFLPGLGLIAERTGMTAAEAASNEYRLAYINGFRYADYTAASCRGQRLDAAAYEAATTPAPPAAITYGTTTPPREKVIQNLTEVDKEQASAAQSQPAPAPAEYGYGPRRGLIDCPEMPGEGYHIVQPKETLNGIARAYKVKIASLIAWNNLKNPNELKPCQKIYITTPPRGLPTPLDKSGRLVIAGKPGKSSTRPVGYDAQPLAQVQSEYWYPTAAPQPLGYEYQTTARSAAAPATAAVTPIYYTVLQGESLYSISQRYGFTVDRFRRMNGLPENAVLQPGQQLVVNDCTCSPNAAPNYLAPTSPATYSTNTRSMIAPSDNYRADPTPQPRPATGVFTEYQINRGTDYTPQNVTPLTYDYSNGLPKRPTGQATSSFGNHKVQANETLGTIASKYGVTAEAIAAANSLEKNEVLIVGMNLMIPVR